MSFEPFNTILEIVFVYVICDGYLQKDFSFSFCWRRAEQQGRQSCFLCFYNEKEAKESGNKSDEQNSGWQEKQKRSSHVRSRRREGGMQC